MIRSDSKDIYNVTNDSISDKCCSFDIAIHLSILRDKMYVSTKIWTFFNIDNNHKCLLSIRSWYQSDFWRITWHWRLE